MRNSLKPETRERLWIIEHFRVLPTDERYLGLTDAQVSIIINNWLYSLGDEDLKRFYWEKKLGEEKDLPGADDLSELGYSPEQIERIRRELSGVRR